MQMNTDDIKKYRKILSEAIVTEAPAPDKTDLFVQHAITDYQIDYYTNDPAGSDRKAQAAAAKLRKIEDTSRAIYGSNFTSAMIQHSQIVSDILYTGRGQESVKAPKIRAAAGVDSEKYFQAMTQEFSGYKPHELTPPNIDTKMASTYMKASGAMDKLSRTLRIMGSKRTTNRERNEASTELTAQLAQVQKMLSMLGK